MRTTLLATAALCGLALALPAAAQNATQPANPVSAGVPAAAAPLPGMAPAAPDSNAAGQPPAAGPAGAPPEQVQPGAMADQSPPASSQKRHHAHHVMSASDDSGHWAHEPGTGESGPASMKASNIDSADTHSAIAPHLPQPKVGDHEGVSDYLQAADQALQKHRSGEAQQALEMAETRLLDRSTPADNANQPDQNPAIAQVASARKALAGGDIDGTRAAIRSALASAGQTSAGQAGGMDQPGSGGMGSPANPAPGGGPTASPPRE